MNRNVFTLAILLFSINAISGTEDTGTSKNIFENLTERVKATWNRLKDRANETIDEITQQTVQELSHEIIEHVKKDDCYKKAIEEHPDDLAPWIILKVYAFPKHAIKTVYSHHIAGDKKIKFQHLKKAINLANAELNTIHERSKHKPVA